MYRPTVAQWYRAPDCSLEELGSISFVSLKMYDVYLNLLFLQEVRPTVFVGVPRVWEKFKEAMESQLREATGIKEVVLGKARVGHVIFM